GTTIYTYNALNQLITESGPQRAAIYTYDVEGNRVGRTLNNGVETRTTSYAYDFENRLISVQTPPSNLDPRPSNLFYSYDHRTRRVQRIEDGALTSVVFSAGLSVQEFDNNNLTEYLRGSDLGGGIGGLLYSLRGGVASYTHANGRGDITAKTNAAGQLTYQSTYEAFGLRTGELGATDDRQKANTKEEDPDGLLNEGMRYRDLETGTFLTRDPAGFVDGPNLYTYVVQNPWTSYDPEGLASAETEQKLNDIQHFFEHGERAIDKAAAKGSAAIKAADKTLNDNEARIFGAVRLGAGVGEIALGVAAAPASGGAAVALAAHGMDDVVTGWKQFKSNRFEKSYTQQLGENIALGFGASESQAEMIGTGVDLAAGLYSGKMAADISEARAAFRSGRAVDRAGRTGCFVAGTCVATADGSKPIEQIVTGDLVWSNDLSSNERHLNRVVKTFIREVSDTLVVNAGNERLETTAEHPFWVVNGEDLASRQVPGSGVALPGSPGAWVQAQQLRVGDTLLNIQGELMAVNGTFPVEHSTIVYNFEVEWKNNYFVGESGLLVHNNCQNFTAELKVSDGTARDHLRSSLNLVTNGGLEGHHLIPWGLKKHSIVEKAAKAGFNINGAMNGLGMTTNRHRGVNIFHHNVYSKAVKKKLDRFARDNPSVTNAQASKFLSEYAEQLRKGIQRSRGRLR
ncbi:MAG: polymorphic toxin-type HINT domain-containing protein, partial [Verrucomicrobiota bacterium]